MGLQKRFFLYVNDSLKNLAATISRVMLVNRRLWNLLSDGSKRMGRSFVYSIWFYLSTVRMVGLLSDGCFSGLS